MNTLTYTFYSVEQKKDVTLDFELIQDAYLSDDAEDNNNYKDSDYFPYVALAMASDGLLYKLKWLVHNEVDFDLDDANLINVTCLGEPD